LEKRKVPPLNEQKAYESHEEEIKEVYAWCRWSNSISLLPLFYFHLSNRFGEE